MLSPRSPDLSDENNHKGKTSVRVGENVNVFVYKKSPQLLFFYIFNLFFNRNSKKTGRDSGSREETRRRILFPFLADFSKKTLEDCARSGFFAHLIYSKICLKSMIHTPAPIAKWILTKSRSPSTCWFFSLWGNMLENDVFLVPAAGLMDKCCCVRGTVWEIVFPFLAKKYMRRSIPPFVF